MTKGQSLRNIFAPGDEPGAFFVEKNRVAGTCITFAT